MENNNIKKKYFSIIANIVNTGDTNFAQSQLDNLEKTLKSGGFDNLPDMKLTEDEAISIIPHFSYHLVEEGNLAYLGLTYDSSDSPRLNANIKPDEQAFVEGGKDQKIIYKLNLKTFIIHLINSKSQNSLTNIEKVNLIWEMYDTDKDNRISLVEMEALLFNFNDSNFLYFDRPTLKEIALILFEKLDPYKQGFITKEAFIHHIDQFKEKPLSLNLIQNEKIKDPENTSKIKELAFSPIKAYWLLNCKSITWLIIYLISNIFWGVYFFVLAYNPDFVAVALAKFFAGVINWNMALLLLFTCKNFFTLFSGTFIFTIFPLKDLKYLHSLCAIFFMIASVGHTLVHLVGTFIFISSNPKEKVNKFLNTKLEYDASYSFLLFQTVFGITGIILLGGISLIFFTTLEKVITKKYEVFWYVHKFYYIIFIFTFFHGLAELFSRPIYWKFIIGPGSLFIIELFVELFRYNFFKSKIISVKILDGQVIEFITTKPKCFSHRPGQYAKINIPDISLFQFHPFTISSAPHHSNLVFYIAPLGNWTKNLLKIAKHFTLDESPEVDVKTSLKEPVGNFSEMKKKTHFLFYQSKPIENYMIRPYCYLDGPIGAPCERYEKYSKLVFIAGGIGATPFASILFTLLYDIRFSNEVKYEDIHFIWVVRNINSALWMIHLIKRIFAQDKNKVFKISLYITSTSQKCDLRSFFLWHGLELLKEERREKVSGYCENIFWGRPCFKDILTQQRNLLESKENNNLSKIGVFVCANYSICKDVLISCRQVSSGQVKFVFHKENF